VIAQIEPHDSIARFEALGVTVIPEMAHFTGPRAVDISNPIKSAQNISSLPADHSQRCHRFRGWIKLIFTAMKPFSLIGKSPDHLLIIGGGPFGVEMAQAHARLGCDVTLVEAFRIMGRDDPSLVEILKQNLIQAGITLD
jgi:pyruvate/2-oxoglutarate dehydrogenase complex dihydrolipoamide dehydrogenase (E3) component